MTANKTYSTPLERLYHWHDADPERVFLRQPVSGELVDFSWAEVDSQVRRMASALLAMGLTSGDRVAILAKNSAEWFIIDLAIQMADLISVPLYPMQTATSIRYVMDHSESKAIVIGKLDDADTMEPGIPDGVVRIGMPYNLGMRVDHNWNDLLATYEPMEGCPVRDMDATMTIIYTSGTTGNPKGVIHTYRSYSFGCENAPGSLDLGRSDRFLSFLPLSHIAERFMVEGAALYAGATVYFVESLTTFATNLQQARPTVFFAVPRLWKKFQSQIFFKLPEKKLARLLRIPVLGNIVRNKIKSQLGLDQCRVTISGAAPIARSLLDWYQTIGIEINEGYGLTEQLAYGTLNLPGKVRFGTVGQVNVLPENNVRISEDGEIQFKSTALMKGYYLEPEKTAETFTEDGWLKTGDRGEIDADGYLKITGRVKDVFKTSKGKFVQPVKIETKLARNTFIEQVCVMGSGHPQPFAMIELSEEARSRMPTMRREIANALINTLTDVNKELDHHEMLERIFVVKDNWTPDNGFTTPTLKIKRNVLEKHYEALAEKYRDSRIDFVWEDEER